MTTAEAIEELNERIENIERYYADGLREYLEVLKMAVEALWNQEPIKPIYYHVEGKCCPNCFERATFQTWKHGGPVVIKMNYCQNCGQKIDWAEELE